MNPTIPYPAGSNQGNVMTVEKFSEAAGKGVFTSYEVQVFYGNDTHYDPQCSAWVAERPPEATKVYITLTDRTQ